MFLDLSEIIAEMMGIKHRSSGNITLIPVAGFIDSYH